MNLSTFKEKVRSWRANHSLGVIAIAAVLGACLGLVGYQLRPGPVGDEKSDQIEALEARVGALERTVATQPAPVAEQPTPEPMPARAGVPRALVRATQSAALAKPIAPSEGEQWEPPQSVDQYRASLRPMQPQE